MKNIIVICGPTGIGKTSFAIALAKKFNGEIIGADSMQIYKYLDIGTAKPSFEETRAAVHHLVDFLDPKETYDAGRYVQDADRAIDHVFENNRLPIVAGGTGLYIKALLHGLFRSQPVCEKTLADLNDTLEKKGPQYLYQQLECFDPLAAEKLHPNDVFRVIRALEVYLTSGSTISGRQNRHDFKTARYRYLKIGLFMDRQTLYERINQRVDMMLENGLLNETVKLVDMGYSLDLKSMQSIGYRHMGLYLNGSIDWNEAVRLLKRDTRRYAKRQFTWFNQDKEIQWVKPGQTDMAADLIKDFLT